MILKYLSPGSTFLNPLLAISAWLFHRHLTITCLKRDSWLLFFYPTCSLPCIFLYSKWQLHLLSYSGPSSWSCLQLLSFLHISYLTLANSAGSNFRISHIWQLPPPPPTLVKLTFLSAGVVLLLAS